jgi:hypothetical protein
MNLQYLSLDKGFLFNWHEGLILNSISRLEGKKLTDGKIEYYKQEFFKQYHTHFASIRALYPGLKIIYKGKENEITASASILVLTRSCLENYSMFYYIYMHSKTQEAIYFKFWSWFREGLMRRQCFILSHNTDKQKEEKHQLDTITNELINHPEFFSLTEKQQKRFLEEGKWYFCGRSKLLELSGFSRPLASNCYNYFSSYTHPTSSSVLQTSQANYDDSKQITDSMVKALFIATGFYLQAYQAIFNETTELYTEKDQDFILSWCELGKELMK